MFSVPSKTGRLVSIERGEHQFFTFYQTSCEQINTLGPGKTHGFICKMGKEYHRPCTVMKTR